MPWAIADRQARQFNISVDDQRPRFARDRDRILYSSAFHRLAGITQIVRAGELDIFHTRQQHTYKVAQVGRRLAENVLNEQREIAEAVGVHPEVVEAACLAHDLGHPPFGHAAESALDRLVRNVEGISGFDCDNDGFEGNAQSFRILTKLAVRYDECLGLDLTRATLAATLKYPWFRNHADEKKRSKWSAYQADAAAFTWTREFHPDDRKTAEAEIMDWADDIAYSVHDLEDFHRVGVIQWDVLSPASRTRIVEAIVSGWFAAPSGAAERADRALDRLREILLFFPAVRNERYDGRREQRRQLRNLTSLLIGRYIRALSLNPDPSGPSVLISEESSDEVRVLKHIARTYVIGLPALHAQQFGQKKIISDLFEIFVREAQNGKAGFIPMRLRHVWESEASSAARAAADCIASLTENETYQLHRRLTGSETGSILDPVVR
ncbi:MAG: deoxyguanosinetriphosphate triphosphohydrolase family protein [Sphingomicrobium sp.]